MRIVFLAVAMATLTLSACSDSTLSTMGSQGSPGDANIDTAALSDISSLTDTRRTPEQGEFGSPCEDDIECLSRYCIQYRDTYMCTELCAGETCEPGWHCATLENTGSDAVRLCIPNPESLCRLCDNNTDCGGLDDMCYELGEQRVCGRDCNYEPCPTDYVCATVTDLAGGEGRQCVPAYDRCSCPEIGANRPCVSANGFGICEGIEVCQGQDGWSECTAATPVEEDCDGYDNDCDGSIDEELPPQPCVSARNDIGVCEGTKVCRGLAGWECDAEPPTIELCDGIDNDCNDIVDDGICYDGNPCTNDICDPETDGCFFTNHAGPCDDGNVCTENTVCVDEVCVGSERNCDDDNPCTADRCEPGVGCVRDELDGASCEMGNYCTNDICQRGVCVQGPEIDCNRGNTCERASCNPATGCQYDLLSGISCEDGDVCTVSDFCSNGNCVEGRDFCAGTTCVCPGGGIAVAICVDFLGSATCPCIGLCP